MSAPVLREQGGLTARCPGQTSALLKLLKVVPRSGLGGVQQHWRTPDVQSVVASLGSR